MAADWPLVSIVIPCYNAEAYVSDAIESALRQTYPNIEVVVVDDGSTDSSLSKIKSFGKKVACHTGPNRGGCAARNLGLALSHGELIQFLDADDMLYPEKLERQVRTLPECSEEVSYCDWREEWIHRKSVSQANSTMCFNEDSVLTVLLGIVQTPSVLHRRSILERLGGFRLGLPCSQERELHLRMACNGVRFKRLPEELYLVRRRKGSVCWDRGRFAEYASRVDLEWFSYLSDNERLTEDRRRAFAKSVAKYARWLVAAGKVGPGRRCLETAQGIHATGWREIYGRRESVLLDAFGFVATECIVQTVFFAQERVRRGFALGSSA